MGSLVKKALQSLSFEQRQEFADGSLNGLGRNYFETIWHSLNYSGSGRVIATGKALKNEGTVM